MENLDEFVKNLRILYVEDDDLTRKQFSKILKKLFKNIEIEANGLDGFLKFQEQVFKNRSTFDLIITDIDMPKLSGIEMIEKVRDIDNQCPVIYITAKNSAEILLKAIELGTLNFVTKPIDIDNLIKTIKNSCEKLYYQTLFKNKSSELERYYNVIEQVAIVTRGDLKGNITYVNKNFCEVTGYEKDEVIGKNHSILKVKTATNIELYKNLWSTIQKGEIWTGTFKNLNKYGEIFYRKASVVPIFENEKEIVEYISISFVTTEEEKLKRNLSEKLIKNIASHKKEISEVDKIKAKYQNDIKALRNLVATLNEKIKKLQAQKVSSNNPKIDDGDKKLQVLKQKNEEIQNVNKLNIKLKDENNELLVTKRDLEERITHRDETIQRYKEEIAKLKSRLR